MTAITPAAKRQAKKRSISCHGSKRDGYFHHPDCRPGRPMCATMRLIKPNRRPCTCDAYLFPHRSTSGLCGNEALKWAKQNNLTLEEVRILCA